MLECYFLNSFISFIMNKFVAERLRDLEPLLGGRITKLKQEILQKQQEGASLHRVEEEAFEAVGKMEAQL